MKSVAVCLLAVVTVGIANALEPVSDDYWDTTRHPKNEPNVNFSVMQEFDAQCKICACAIFDSFDSASWTMHRSNVLEVFRSTPPGGFFLLVR